MSGTPTMRSSASPCVGGSPLQPAFYRFTARSALRLRLRPLRTPRHRDALGISYRTSTTKAREGLTPPCCRGCQAYDALFGPGSGDPVTGYQAYLDLDSYVDWYMVQELLKNQDANWSSAYMYKDRSSKLHFGPLWDFDLSMGTTRGIVPVDPEQWWVDQPGKPWVNKLGADVAFRNRLNQRWDSIKASVDQLPQQIIDLGSLLEEAVANDAARWNYTVAPEDTPTFLADWLTTRTAWFDARIDARATP